MRRLLLLIALALPALLTPAPPGGAARRESQCPVVKVSCPDTANPGERIDFNALVEPAGAGLKLNYTWEVSAGTVEGGQSASSLKLDTTGISRGQVITATVEVAGLPEGCERKASCSTVVPQAIIGCGFDEYGNIKFDDEKARLDNFAIELQNDPTAEGYLTCYGGRRGYEGEARRRCERAKNYVATVRGIEPARIVTVDGGFRTDLTVRLTIVPAGAAPPEPAPTVDPREVIILKNGRGQKSRRR
ncbi:MAG TPA: hypothetical protein VF588_04210 [Pyrinomonadaceae bacterium]|jgi:hypothetical protein